ncbi:hypothetical protein BsWGS_23892 [Bradybaena similaris]
MKLHGFPIVHNRVAGEVHWFPVVHNRRIELR